MEAKKVISIHQPNFFPWLGYFYKIYCSSVFVLLDDVQMQKTGSNYTNRVSILGLNGTPIFLTIPIKRPPGIQIIKDVQVLDQSWREKFRRSIQSNYSKAKFWKKYRDFIFDLIEYDTASLSNFNEFAIREIINKLSIKDVNLVSSSSFEVNGSASEKLIKLTQAVGGDVYLSGSGGVSYQDEDLFMRNSVGLVYIKYPAFKYNQIGSTEFSPGLSIIDSILNIGFEGIQEIFNAKKDYC